MSVTLSERERVFKKKRFLSFITVLNYLFFSGFEYVIILPTVWSYLQTLGVTEEFWLGFTISIYSFAAAVFGVIVGRLADKYFQHTKFLVSISILFRVIGNFQYMFGISIYNVMCARFFCGMGASAGTALLAEVCRTTTVEERTMFLSISNAMFQVGVLVGPALQLLLAYFEFTIFGFQVTPLNAAGLFLGSLWLFFAIANMFMFHNLSVEFQEIQAAKKKLNEIEGAEGAAFLNVQPESVGDEENMKGAAVAIADKKRGIYELYREEFLSDSYIALMSFVFALFFAQMAFETVTPVIVQGYFGLQVNQITLIYMCGGLEAIMTYVGMAYIGKFVRESTMQIIGWSLIFSAQLWLFIVMPNFENGNQTHLIYFLVGIFLIYFGAPVSQIGNTALCSKVLSPETQGLGQGLRRLICYIGLIYGPMWAGSTVQSPVLFLGVSIALMLMNGVMLAVSWKRLREVEDKIKRDSSTMSNGDRARENIAPATTDDESTALLSSLR